jgi:alkanesulfonate monooxygenase SsuD/methylene tetrahydromethanopterin reductase-like flavin-dependent oxidoreductase (luciferase family)
MHIGYAPIFSNIGNELPDATIYAEELRLAEMAEDMGFDSVWESEHHFTDYEMTPNVLNFLSYMAGRTKTVRLGSLVVILPWHNPLRVAEDMSLLDHVSGGRYILGIGRGLGAYEMEGWGVDMNNTREIFNESAEALLTALRDGRMEFNGNQIKQPSRDIRPAPLKPFTGRSYGAGHSPESFEIMARLGLGAIVFPFKEWSGVKTNLDAYARVWAELRPDTIPPKPATVVFPFVDKDPKKAEAMAIKYVGHHYKGVLKNYDFGGKHFANLKGYEHYAANASDFEEVPESQIRDFVNLMPYGTPEQVIEKTREIDKYLDLGCLITHFRFGNMPYEMAERSMRLFVDEVMPELHSWDKGEFAKIDESIKIHSEPGKEKGAPMGEGHLSHVAAA